MTEPRTPTVLVRAGRSARLQALLMQDEGSIEKASTSGLRVGPMIARGSSDRPRGLSGLSDHHGHGPRFSALSDLIMATLAIEQATVDGPTWSLRPGSPLYRAARLAAVADARARAEDYATAFGAEITALLNVADTDAVGHVPSRMARMGQPGGGEPEPAFELEPAEQEVTGQITVRFAISEPDLGIVSARWLRSSR